MLKFIASMAIAAFLSLSPALAVERGHSTPPPKVMGCMSPEALLQTVPPQFKLASWLDGDKIVRLAKLVGEDLPSDTDLILVFANEDLRRENLFMIQLFSKGCITGHGVITQHAMNVANSIKDDEDDTKSAPPRGWHPPSSQGPAEDGKLSHRPSRHGPSGWDGKL